MSSDLTTQSRRMVVLLLSFYASALFGRAQERRVGAPQCPGPVQSALQAEERVGEYVIRAYRANDGGGCVQIVAGDRVVFSRQTGGRFYIGAGFEPERPASAKGIALGADITGVGGRNLVLSEWTGGGHCCYVFRVLRLEENVREIAFIDVQDAVDSYFADLDSDRIYELVARDYTFAYWHASFATSPAPRVVLRFNGTRYELALDLMRKPPPDGADLHRVTPEVGEGGYPKPLLWKEMLDLIYTGHPDLAWKLVSGLWPGRLVSREEFLRGFCGQLANSPYFEALRPNLTGAPCVFDPKNGERM